MALNRYGAITGSGSPASLPDAPVDGVLYGRKDAAWVVPTAAEVTNAPAGGLVAVTVQAAIDELQTAVTAGAGLAAHLADTVDAHDASAISFAPAGAVAATDVQGAIAELDTEKAALAGAAFTGAVSTTGILTTSAGAVNVYGWGADVNAGVVFLNQAQTRYLYYTGTEYTLAGAGLTVGGSVQGTTFRSTAATASRAAYFDANKDIQPANTTLTELNYVNGVTSAIQTQLDGKLALTTIDAKGDLLAGTADNTIARLAVGANATVLTADSTQATGMKWAAPAATLSGDTLWDAKGDLVVATAADTAARLAVGANGYVLTADSSATPGVSWQEPGTTSAPTVQTFTSGSGTYTKPSGCTRIHVRMVGGGGGGVGGGSASWGAGGTGGSTTFGAHTAAGGATGSAYSVGGTGGAGTLGAGAIGLAVTGMAGAQGAFSAAADYAKGGDGGDSPYFSGGGSGGSPSSAGVVGQTNTGGGGGGGGTGSAANVGGGAGGGSGGFCDFIIAAPASTYSYAVGAGGTAGAAGTNGFIAGVGGAGKIVVTEYYGNFDSVLQLTEPAATKQRFTSGSGTYTTPAGVNKLRVRMIGGGGGGAGGGTASWGVGGTGGTTTFGSSLLTASGGGGATNYGVVGSGGTGTISAPATGVSVTGAYGAYGSFNIPSSYGLGGMGGASPFFSGGSPGGTAGSAGANGLANTGGGGGGGSSTNTSASAGGAGGSAGGFVDAWIYSPSATYAYAVGAVGSAGAAGTNGLAGGTGGSGVIEVEEFYGPTNTVADTIPLGGYMRNRFINGNMRIDQRNSGSAISVSAPAYSWGPDRWGGFGQTADGVFSMQQLATGTPPAGFSHYLRVKTTTADAAISAAQLYLVKQTIEGSNVSDLDWGLSTAKTVTLSFYVRSSLTGTFGGSIFNSAVTRNYVFSYTIDAANTWERKTVVIAGDTSGTWLNTPGAIGALVFFDLGAGSSGKGAAGAWTASTLYGVTSGTNVIGTLNATWDITGAQFEAGSVATAYENTLYGPELERCKRYYQTGVFANLSYGQATAAMGLQVTFPVTMATTPAMTHAYSYVNAASGSADTITAAGFRAFALTTATAATQFYDTWTANAEL